MMAATVTTPALATPAMLIAAHGTSRCTARSAPDTLPWPVRGGGIGVAATHSPPSPSPLVCRATVGSRTEAGDTRPVKEVCRNRKAAFNYELLERYECGLELQGSEIKSIRAGEVSLQEAFCKVIDEEMILINSNVTSNKFANRFDNHEPARMRKLLMRKKEILKIRQKSEEKGLTVVPLRMYFRGSWVKVEIALARGKNTVDKRQDIKEKDMKRDLGRISKLQY